MWETFILKMLDSWLWWFGNKDEPQPPDWFEINRPYWQRFVLWYFRNPAHNLTHYVVNAPIGEIVSSKPLGPDPVFAKDEGWLYGYRKGNTDPDFPWISYKKGNREFWAGWHPGNGKLGARGFPPLWS